MVNGNMLNGLGIVLVISGLIIACTFWAGFEIADWLFIDDVIKSTEPITPEIEIIVKDNVIDTLYLYRKP